MKTLICAALLLIAMPLAALEISTPSGGCSSSDVSAGRSLWKQIDKAADGSVVKLTNTENRRLWCYSDSLHAADGITPEKGLAVHITVQPDPDADHDGVPDDADVCPKSAAWPDSTSAKPVDSKGCTLPEVK
jgi:hypothetical protein